MAPLVNENASRNVHSVKCQLVCLLLQLCFQLSDDSIRNRVVDLL